ncbi:uncharacterized protein VP01_1228g8 [Puccinia sorghi]|uniref:Uncharacterized protein n=1 Tax=Puccinia sorghi TaxID=27349 RepID=A0A0L6VPU1_9BASI|nr:uncharacterized protein VP01_1228g8 [Puccinia sorghi]
MRKEDFQATAQLTTYISRSVKEKGQGGKHTERENKQKPQHVACQLPFMIRDRKVSEAIKNIEGHKSRDWELLMKEYDENSIQFKILSYLKNMGYENVNTESRNSLWNAISRQMRREVEKELAHNRRLQQMKDGKGLIPKLDGLKEYVEASLSILALWEQNPKWELIQQKKGGSKAKSSSLIQFRMQLNFYSNRDLTIISPIENPYLLTPKRSQEEGNKANAIEAPPMRMPTMIWVTANTATRQQGKGTHLQHHLKIRKLTTSHWWQIIEDLAILGWVEGDSDDRSSNSSGNKETDKKSGKETEKNAKLRGGGGLRKKILKQILNFKLEELLLIEPKFIQEFQNFSKDEVMVMGHGQNLETSNHRYFEADKVIERGCHQSPEKTLKYATPLGFVNMTINGRKLRELVDSGAELNIMPEEVALRLELIKREISMNITGIFAKNFFIVCGNMYIVLGRSTGASEVVTVQGRNTKLTLSDK